MCATISASAHIHNVLTKDTTYVNGKISVLTGIAARQLIAL